MHDIWPLCKASMAEDCESKELQKTTASERARVLLLSSSRSCLRNLPKRSSFSSTSQTCTTCWTHGPTGGGSCGPSDSRLSVLRAFSWPPSTRTRHRCLESSQATHMADFPFSSGAAARPVSRTQQPGRGASPRLSSFIDFSAPPSSSTTSQRCLGSSQLRQVARWPFNSIAPWRPWSRTGAPGQKGFPVSLAGRCSLRFSGRSSLSVPWWLTAHLPFSASQRTHMADFPLSSGIFKRPTTVTMEPSTRGSAAVVDDDERVEGSAFAAPPPAWASSSPKRPNSTVFRRKPSFASGFEMCVFSMNAFLPASSATPPSAFFRRFWRLDIFAAASNSSFTSTTTRSSCILARCTQENSADFFSSSTFGGPLSTRTLTPDFSLALSFRPFSRFLPSPPRPWTWKLFLSFSFFFLIGMLFIFLAMASKQRQGRGSRWLRGDLMRGWLGDWVRNA
mmetsp:Transcript_49975/g.143666  ORF Transcript_49975/g.143666 Transcript_49975/m.143666 type:complete len:449 (-) Transcript_49975:2-1348(-)